MEASITPRGASAKADAFTRAYEALASSPHGAEVAATSHNPLTGELPITPIRMPQGRTMVPVSYMYVSPGYFSTVQIPLDRGRTFGPDEARRESKVAVVSAAAARALWPNTDPLGKTIRVWMAPEERPDVITHDRLLSTTQIDTEGDDVVVIGVAKDVVSGLVTMENVGTFFCPRVRVRGMRERCSSAAAQSQIFVKICCRQRCER